jgi:Family of unknown function (DUF6174)
MSTEWVPTQNRNWVWTFIGIALVAVVLLTWLALFIYQQIAPDSQLKLDQLRAARERWEAKKIKDYQMVYTVLRAGDAKKDQFFVDVRGGKVHEVVMNGQERLPEEKLEYHSMAGLFNDIELFLQRDSQPGSPPTFCRGYFDSADGHLLQFIRRVVGGTERVEIKVEEFRPNKGG